MKAEEAWDLAADAEVRKAKETRDEVFASILRAANGGHYSITVYSSINQELTKELLALGYRIQIEKDWMAGMLHTIISWDK